MFDWKNGKHLILDNGKHDLLAEIPEIRNRVYDEIFQLLVIRPEPLLTPLLRPHNAPQNVHYQNGHYQRAQSFVRAGSTDAHDIRTICSECPVSRKNFKGLALTISSVCAVLDKYC